MMFSSTIAAISTPYGRGGVALIRISGDDAFEIADRIFLAKNRKKLSETEHGRIVYGEIISHGEIIDDGMAAIFKAPSSYTGENTVEITCHGGLLVTEEVLTAILSAGAVQAEAGEFTKRAFINGKLSLSEAEAVINLIDAETKDKMKLARSHSSGVFTKEIERLYSKLLALVSQTYVYTDYPDEDLSDLTPTELFKGIEEIKIEIDALLSTYVAGHAINDGIYTVVAGKPNTGKSSLMNTLLGRERAIVSSHAGTTRDYLEEKAVIGKVMLLLVDTAGIRSSEDEIEKIGIERSLEALSRAELVLALFDPSSQPDSEDIEFIEELDKLDTKKIVVFNKSDLSGKYRDEYLKLFKKIPELVADISAEKKLGIKELSGKIEELFVSGEIDYNSKAIVANARQKASLEKSFSSLNNALSALSQGFTQDIAGLDIELAMSALAETDGRNVSTDIVDSIFHRFCVGK